MKYKMLVLDIDGTLVNSKKELTPTTKKALIDLQHKGVIVALASGRPFPGVAPLANELQLDQFGSYILTFNGARTINWKTKEIVYNKTLPDGLLKKIYKDAKKYNTGLTTYKEDHLVIDCEIDKYIQLESDLNQMPIKQVDNLLEYIDYPLNKCILTQEGDVLQDIEPILANKYKHEALVFRSEPYFLEIMPRNVDKAYCLSKLIEIIGIEREEMVCCGDGFNDVTMIQYAGLGVAMANAQEAAKEVADYITDSNDEDGIVKVIERFF